MNRPPRRSESARSQEVEDRAIDLAHDPWRPHRPPWAATHDLVGFSEMTMRLFDQFVTSLAQRRAAHHLRGIRGIDAGPLQRVARDIEAPDAGILVEVAQDV